MQGGNHRVSDEAKGIGQDEVEALLAEARADESQAGVAAALASSKREAGLEQSASVSSEPKPLPANTAAKSAEGLLNQAQQALASVDQLPSDLPPGIKPFELRNLTGRPAAAGTSTLDLLRDVQLDLKIELGRTHMQLEDVLQLKSGAVVALDKLAGDPVDIFVNGRLIARGEVLVMNDNFCVRVAELVVGESVPV